MPIGPWAAAALGAGAMGLAGNLFGGRNREDPGNAAMAHLQNNPQFGREAYNPFIQQGQQAGQQLHPREDQMAQNPNDYYNQIMGQYQESPNYKYQLDKQMQGAHNTAAAGGLVGTEGDVRNRAELMHALMGTDMQQYLQNIMGIQGRGMLGQESRVERGYGAAGSLADYLGNSNAGMAGYAGEGARYRNDTRAQRRNNIYGALANLIGGGLAAHGGGAAPAAYNPAAGAAGPGGNAMGFVHAFGR
jgi:hypothetical protein